MRNERLRSAQKQGDDGRPSSTDFISTMPDDVLVMILSLLRIKHAAVTSSLSTRWRFVWRNVTQLNFNSFETLDKYINQVNGAINSYNHPRVKDFRIHFSLDNSYSVDIDSWIQFALDKKVVMLDLDLGDNSRDQAANYNFRLPSLNAMDMEMFFLKELYLDGVNMNEPTLNRILKNSPHLTVLDIYHSDLSTNVNVGGKEIKLKYLKLVGCSGFESITLYGFGLVSFRYGGPETEFRFTDLPKLEEVDIGEVSVGFENNVFRQISSCAPYFRVLILDMWSQRKGLDVNAIIKLPNVKKLMLVIGAEEDDSLLEFTSIARACPRLETFSISLHWYALVKRRKEVRHVAASPVHKHLKLLEIIGYYGRISDLELAVYVIDNSVALKKIVIDPCSHASDGELNTEELLKREQEARLSARCQLTPILPTGVDLAIL